MANFAISVLLVTVGISFAHCQETPKPISRSELMYRDLVNLNIDWFMDRAANSIRSSMYGKNETDYRIHFQDIFATALVPAVTKFFEPGASLLVKTDKSYYVFEFTVNRTAKEAFAVIDEYKSKYYNDGRDLLCIGVNFRHIGQQELVSVQDRLVCSWVANLYSENGALKRHFPGEENVYTGGASQLVEMNRASVTVFYDILDLIGKGDNTVVHTCQEKRSRKYYAAKFRYIRWPTHIMKERIFVELDVMKVLTPHPRLVKLHEVFEEEESIIMIVDLLRGGTLFDREKSCGGSITEAETVNLIRQIAEGVKHMHENNIVHLDLHPGNIMCLTKSPCTEVKIIDFSKAGNLDTITLDYDKGVVERTKGVAPEIMEARRVGFYTDMWSLGIVTYYLISGTFPTYASRNDSYLPKDVVMSKLFEENAFNTISEEGKDFIRRLLIVDREKRMTIHESLNHAWLRRAS